MGEFPAMNAIYAELFPEAPPARAAVQATALPLGAKIMIELVAQACDCGDPDASCDCDCECA
jgi:2-iminobutanoate/2-iminopropanoate deaminase